MTNTQNVSLDFSTEDQSIWSEGSDYTYDWEVADTLGFTPQVEWDESGSASLVDGNIKLGVFTDGNIGLDAGFSVSSGAIDATLPVDLSLTLPDSVSLGDTISLSGSYSLGDDASFTTTTPDFSAFLEAAFSIEAGGSIDIFKVVDYDLKAVDIGEEFAFAFDTSDGEISYSEDGITYTDIADVSSSDSDSVSLESSDIFNITVDTPDLDTTGYLKTNGTSLTGTSYDSLVSGSIDIDDLITSFIPGEAAEVLSAANSGDYTFEAFGNTAAVQWDYIDADLNTAIDAGLDFQLDTNLAGTITFEDEVLLSDGSYATEISFDSIEEIPEFSVDSGSVGGSDGDLDATVTIDLEATLTNSIDLYFQEHLGLTALEASASYDTSWGSGGFSQDPAVDESYSLLNETIELYSDSFDLAGLDTTSFDIAIAIEDSTITGTSGDDNLTGTDYGELIYGLAGDDYIDAGAGDDTVVGGEGADTMYGGAGEDLLDFADGDQGVNFSMETFGGYGYDAWGDEDYFHSYYNGFEVVSGTSDDDVMQVYVNPGNDSYTTYQVDFIGEGGNDYLSGSGKEQSLDGGTGDDTLVGAGGDDTLTGGTGADVFMYDGAYGGNSLAYGGTDTITDFSVDDGDIFQLSANVYGISDVSSDVTFDTSTGELFAGTRSDAIAILDGVTSFDATTSVELI